MLEAPCFEHLDLRITRRHHPHAHSRPDAFWLVALALVILLFGVTLPTPFAWLLLGLGLLMLGLDVGELAVFVAGIVGAGIGVGLVMMGAIATVNRVAPPEHRAEVISAFFLSAYAGLAIPALAVGIASQHVGFFRATLVCSIVLAALLGAMAARIVVVQTAS